MLLADESSQESVGRPSGAPLRVLFLCTHNTARSQMAEALLANRARRHGLDRFVVASAGATPADQVHPLAVDVLRAFGIDWSDRRPKSIDSVRAERWDLIITLCDRAKETCPTFPGRPVFAHWGMEDPCEVFGDETTRRRAFHRTLTHLSRRIDLLLALPIERLARRALELRVQAIADDVPNLHVVPRGHHG